jgi:NAD(P)-dependent dehydrogenase (short-subunit alcohol dehydrogenase family)
MAGMLAGKTALITGGWRGIGRATALLFAAEGAKVAVADLSKDNAAETVAMINAAGGQAISIGGDVTDAAAVEAMVAATVAAFGRLDCAFNNAGISGFQVGMVAKRTHEWEEKAFDRLVEIDLKSVWLCMRGELTQMLKQGGGTIVNTASIAGLIGLRTSSAYVASKHGVVGLTKTAALEYAEDNIRVNAVCPGYITTDMTTETVARRGDALMTMVPAKRMGVAQEIAEMVCWLCSDRASFVTGVTYNVDGGYMAN